ncbi:hypothetical protein [Nitrosovibrio sp. Nv6]|uniref:hypothetical protein n=1 Tax=Nitrosovibrio sp. Nv6 TaxID=1855340 RepID=UPI0008BF733A|nr:hypothetical protein [Nitrosovibrio sp. Nv6]SEP23604.1 hypothetical protein SAMN05216316_2073 [Nitrosovibrio sp. Nv6]
MPDRFAAEPSPKPLSLRTAEMGVGAGAEAKSPLGEAAHPCPVLPARVVFSAAENGIINAGSLDFTFASYHERIWPNYS